MKILFIRHGVTQSNKEHRYLGLTDESLCDDGVEMLKREWENGTYPDVSVVFSSPMKRCVETAQIIFPENNPVIIPEWHEMDFGEFEMKNYLDLKDDPRYQEWIDSNGTLPFPGGETRDEFIKRCLKGFERMCGLLPEDLISTRNDEVGEGCDSSESGYSDVVSSRNDETTVIGEKSEGNRSGDDDQKIIAVVVHGGTVMALLCSLCGGEYFDYQPKNGRGYICKALPVNIEKGAASVALQISDAEVF
ncbi:MAG: histidine phosphatase family protein [Eubacteriales bacterium]|nr:histidine phosphatase family protein [Eubacteriales bacterium]